MSSIIDWNHLANAFMFIQVDVNSFLGYGLVFFYDHHCKASTSRHRKCYPRTQHASHHEGGWLRDREEREIDTLCAQIPPRRLKAFSRNAAFSAAAAALMAAERGKGADGATGVVLPPGDVNLQTQKKKCREPSSGV